MAILIEHAAAVLMDEEGTILPDAWAAVEGSQISYVGDRRPQGSFDEVIDASGQVLLPGLINCHTHAAMTAMRGYGDGHALQDWLHNYIFPAEARWDDRAVRACTALGLAELIASGVTTIADMYGHTQAVAQEVAAAGLNANLSCGGVQFTDGFDPDTLPDCLAQRALTERWHGYNGGQILVDASIHAEYTSPGWPSTPPTTAWGCTSTSPRPSPSTRPASPATAGPRCRCWTAAACGTPGPSPPTASGPLRRTGPSWPPRG